MPARFDHRLRHQYQYQPSRDRGDDTLQKIADATGGRAFFPKRLEEMPVSFQDIQDELRSQYAIVYKPADFKNDGAFRPHLSLLVSTAVTWCAPARAISPPRDKRPVLGVFAVKAVFAVKGAAVAVPLLEPPPPRREKGMLVRA